MGAFISQQFFYRYFLHGLRFHSGGIRGFRTGFGFLLRHEMQRYCDSRHVGKKGLYELWFPEPKKHQYPFRNKTWTAAVVRKILCRQKSSFRLIDPHSKQILPENKMFRAYSADPQQMQSASPDLFQLSKACRFYHP